MSSFLLDGRYRAVSHCYLAGEVHGPPPCEETGSKRVPVPRVTDHVIRAPKTNRNFVHWNALAQMRSTPGDKGEERMVDQPNGNTQLVEKAGLAPKFTFKKVK